VHTMTLEGQTSLLVGKNGGGKSTLVDALLTLLAALGVTSYQSGSEVEQAFRGGRDIPLGHAGA
jgi:ABC-type Mn2+/Zn2+ transport system ATPase subunit